MQSMLFRFDLHICKSLGDIRYRQPSNLLGHCLLTISARRTNEIFDLIVDYPDSMPALLDLKVSSTQHEPRSR